MDAGQPLNLPGGGQLVVVAVLAEGMAARQDHQRPAIALCRQDRADFGMGNHHPGGGEDLLEFRGRQVPAQVECRPVALGRTDLRDHRLAQIGRERVQRVDQAKKGQLRAHRCKDHSTAPAYSAPASAATCSH